MKNIKELLCLFQKYLGKKGIVGEATELGKENNEAFEILMAELNSSIKLFNRLKNEQSDDINQSLKNTKYLSTILKTQDLPPLEQAINETVDSISIFDELAKFEFLRKMKSRNQLLGALMLAFYRTYILVKYPCLRENKAQVASTIEEMLSLLALRGFKTNLLAASKHWILDWKGEGFDKRLAIKIKNLK